MSIVLKVLRCARQCSWMSHLASIVVYIEFAWNYTSFNSNDYFMKTTHLLNPKVTHVSSKSHSSVRTMSIPLGYGGDMVIREGGFC